MWLAVAAVSLAVVAAVRKARARRPALVSHPLPDHDLVEQAA